MFLKWSLCLSYSVIAYGTAPHLQIFVSWNTSLEYLWPQVRCVSLINDALTFLTKHLWSKNKQTSHRYGTLCVCDVSNATWQLNGFLQNKADDVREEWQRDVSKLTNQLLNISVDHDYQCTFCTGFSSEPTQSLSY